jgi:hypothetical protein
MSTCYHHTKEAREALAKAKATKDPQTRLEAVLTATEALANALAILNSGEEGTYRNLERRSHGG